MLKNLKKLSLIELRQIWACEWKQEPHSRIGRTMLEKSLEYKIRERKGRGLAQEQQARLEQLVKQYKRSPACFEGNGPLKPGTRLVRIHEGKKHSVLVKADGFEYGGQRYSSLSQIANNITGKRWNGWIFFGLKKVGKE